VAYKAHGKGGADAKNRQAAEAAEKEGEPEGTSRNVASNAEGRFLVAVIYSSTQAAPSLRIASAGMRELTGGRHWCSPPVSLCRVADC
jgi:hypothetical protein